MQLGITRRQVLASALGAGAAVALPGGTAAAGAATAQDAAEVLARVQTTDDLVLLENLSPPAASRVHAHTAVAPHEAAVQGLPAHRSPANRLRDLPPPPRSRAGWVDRPTAAVTAAAAVLRQVLPIAGEGTRAGVHRYIDPSWTTLVNSPPFPEHTSGHSVASSAAAAVLTDRLGSFACTDRSHDPRGHLPRTFPSFRHAAREAARSRLYGGIHYPHAVSAGSPQGERVGALVLQRLRTRP